MMKLKSIVVFSALLLLGACGGPKIVPDRELARILHDIYLVNAYVGQYNTGLDSLNIYEPVFARYGYTSEDIQYTIGNFAKRKSARLSDDVVEVAIEMLRTESRLYNHRMAVRDSVARVARDKFATVVYSAPPIRVRRIADTSRLRIVVPDIREGSYEVSYDYFVDSTDRNSPLRTEIYLSDGRSGRSGSNQKLLRRAQRENVRSTLSATDDHRSLVLDLNGYPRGLSTPNMTVDSLRVTYYLPEEAALDALSRSWFDTRSLDSLINPHETHLVPHLADPAGASSR